MNSSKLAIVFAIAACVPPASADLTQRFTYSLDWLVDSSDVIAIGVVVTRDRPELRIERILKKCADGSEDARLVDDFDRLKMWPHPAAESGHHVVLFGRKSDGRSLQVFYRIWLQRGGNLPDDPTGRVEYYLKHLPARETNGAMTFRDAGRCIAIDRNGNALTDPARVLERIKTRIRRDHKLPKNCDRESAEATRSHVHQRTGDAATYIQAVNLQNVDLTYVVLVPCDDELEAHFLERLEKGTMWQRWDSIGYLSLFANDRKILAMIKAYLKDESTHMVCGRPTYLLRWGAYEALVNRGFDIPKPTIYAE